MGGPSASGLLAFFLTAELAADPRRALSQSAGSATRVAFWRNCDINLGERLQASRGTHRPVSRGCETRFRALTDSFGAERRIASAPDRETSLRSRRRRCMAG